MNKFESSPQLGLTDAARDIACNFELSFEKENAHELRAFRILEELKNKNLLDPEVHRVKELFGEDLKSLGEEFDKECWEMLTVLELFDTETAFHCVNTFLIAKSKVEKTLWNGIVLANEFKKEDVKLSQFYKACVFHDIGKIEVPHSVLVNKTTDEKCSVLLLENKEDVLIPYLKNKFGDEYVFPNNLNNAEDLLNYLNNKLHIRPQTITPVKLLLEKPITKETISLLAHCGCSVEDSLLKIMQTHDEYSKKILKDLGLNIEGELAGAHHKHKAEDVKYKITIDTLNVTIDLADLVHLADVENAILSKRHYKAERTSLYALKILSMHSRQGLFGGEGYIAYIWISDEINRIKKDDIKDEDYLNFDYIVNFLNDEKKKHPTWPSWDINYNLLKIED